MIREAPFPRAPVHARPLLVTGGAGFIGGNFVLRAASAGWPVVNLDALTYAGNLKTLSEISSYPNHKFVHGDICDRATVERLLQEHTPGAVINFAAETHVDRSINGPAEFIRTNVTGTLVLLEASLEYWMSLPHHDRAAFRFLQVSTDEVYGSLGNDGHFSESSPFAPNSPYSASKAAADHLVRAFHRTYGLPTLNTHCSNNFGPFQHPEKLIPLMISSAFAGVRLPVYGDGRNVRDWLHVSDHCSALARVLEGGTVGENYNIGGESELRNLDVVDEICRLVDRRAPRADGQPRAVQIEFVEDRPGHDFRYSVDIRKIRHELGWSPTINFREGLAATVDWYMSNAEWVLSATRGSYPTHRVAPCA